MKTVYKYKPVRQGYTIREILHIQRALMHLGYKLEDTGQWDSDTEDCMASFKARYHLGQDGKPDRYSVYVLERKTGSY